MLKAWQISSLVFLTFVFIAGCGTEKVTPISTPTGQAPLAADASAHWQLNATEKVQVYGKWAPEAEIYLMTEGAYYFFGDHTFVSSLIQSQFAEESAKIACIGQWRMRDDKAIEIKINSVLVGHPVDESKVNDVVDGVHTGYKSFSIQSVDKGWVVVGTPKPNGRLEMIHISSSGEYPYEKVFTEESSMGFSRYSVDQKQIDVLNSFPSTLGSNDYDRLMKLLEISGGVL